MKARCFRFMQEAGDFSNQTSVVAEIVGVIRKRIVVRSDPSVRLPEVEAEKITRELIAPEAELRT